MSLTTLASVKQSLGITDTSQDDALKHFIRRAVARIRSKTKRYHGGLIESNTAANPTVVTSIGHQLRTGDVISISDSNSSPVINGSQTVTVVDEDTFTVAVDVDTTAGTAGQYAKQFTEFYSGNGCTEFMLRERPVQSITNLWLDNDGYFGDGTTPFASADLLVSGTDYALEHDGSGVSVTGVVHRLNGLWTGTTRRTQGLITSHLGLGRGNIKVTYLAGWLDFPMELQSATEMFVAQLMNAATQGGSMQSENLDYYSYTRLSAEEESQALASVNSMLKSFTTWVV